MTRNHYTLFKESVHEASEFYGLSVFHETSILGDRTANNFSKPVGHDARKK